MSRFRNGTALPEQGPPTNDAKGEIMNKPKLPKKLTLSRETLRILADDALKAVAGGHSAHEATKCSICPGCTL
jgi:hypothetical protein